MSWKDPERVETLKKLWADGLSAGQIAVKLGGVTRNAVISKVHRIGLAGRATTARLQGRRSKKFKPAPKPFIFSQNAPTPTIKLPTLPLPMPAADDKARVSFDDLEANHCRWPVGETQNALPTFPIFCGLDRMPGSSYCQGHRARAYTPLRQRLALPGEGNVVPMKRETVVA
jgi:GcrA cell cycle regulator